MQLFCPACQAAFPGVTRCPRCGGLLLMPHEVSPDAPRRTSEAPPQQRPTAGGRIAIGCVLALGLYLALRKLLTGAVLAAEPDPAAWWLSFRGLTAIYSAQAVAILFGAVLAAAGRAGGYQLGLVVGGVVGGLLLGYEFLIGAPARDLVFYLQVPILALCGLVGGAVGSRIWGAAPALDIPIPSTSKLSSLQLNTESSYDRSRPTIWVRVLAGAVVMIMGVAIADPVRLIVQKNSGGLLRVQSQGQGHFISWQLATISVLVGAVVAAAGTGAGIRHGMLAALLGGAGILGVCAKQGEAVPPVEYLLTRMSLDGLPLANPGVIAAIAGGVMVVGLVGGWLGGTLFLPLIPEHMRNRLRAGLD